MMILIAGEVFHLEAQIDDDLNMALRMFRYGYYEAVKRPRTEELNLIYILSPFANLSPLQQRLNLTHPKVSAEQTAEPGKGPEKPLEFSAGAYQR
jgi:hypothetical protein